MFLDELIEDGEYRKQIEKEKSMWKTLTKDEVDNLCDKAINAAQLVCGNKLKKVILYGSYARGNYHGLSDLDIAVIADVSFKKEREYELKIHLCIEGDVDALISVVVISLELWEEDDYLNYFLYKNIREEGIVKWACSS